MGGERVQVPIKLERDLYFEPNGSLREYCDAARKAGRIIQAEQVMSQTRQSNAD